MGKCSMETQRWTMKMATTCKRKIKSQGWMNTSVQCWTEKIWKHSSNWIETTNKIRYILFRNNRGRDQNINRKLKEKVKTRVLVFYIPTLTRENACLLIRGYHFETPKERERNSMLKLKRYHFTLSTWKDYAGLCLIEWKMKWIPS